MNKYNQLIELLNQFRGSLKQAANNEEQTNLWRVAAHICRLSHYISDLIQSQLELNSLTIGSDTILEVLGNLPLPSSTMIDNLFSIYSLSDDPIIRSQCMGIIRIICVQSSLVLHSVSRQSSAIESWLQSDDPEARFDAASIIDYCRLPKPQVINALTPLLKYADNACLLAIVLLSNVVQGVSRPLFELLSQRLDHPSPLARSTIYEILSQSDVDIIDAAIDVASQGNLDESESARKAASGSLAVLMQRKSLILTIN